MAAMQNLYSIHDIKAGWRSENLCLIHNSLIKVHLTPKYIFRLNKSLHLFEKHCAFLN